jgi:dye decolorizing peroxidase
MVSRRGFLTGAAGTAVGTTLGAVAGTGAGVLGASAAAAATAETATAKRSLAFYGKHQMGIEAPIQAVTTMVALDLLPGTSNSSMMRWMSLLTDDIDRMSRGEPVLADPSPQLLVGPSGLSAYLGFGPSLFTKLGLESEQPQGFAQLPSFTMDRLEPRFSGGDVLIHVAADDPIVLSHAVRGLVRDSLPFATVRWSQSGFAHSPGMVPSGLTHRNLMGQIDGTANPQLNSEDFTQLVWAETGPEWFVGGTQLVFRRIAMQLNTWDTLGGPSKEEVIGRRLSDGSPLTGSKESDVPDLNARHPNGLKVIPDFAHIRRAAPAAPGERIFRRPFSYEGALASDGTPDVGLLWTAYQRNIETQFLPIQRRLEQLDLLNQWTVPVGSAVFAIPGGVMPGEVLAERLFSRNAV